LSKSLKRVRQTRPTVQVRITEDVNDEKMRFKSLVRFETRIIYLINMTGGFSNALVRNNASRRGGAIFMRPSGRADRGQNEATLAQPFCLAERWILMPNERPICALLLNRRLVKLHYVTRFSATVSGSPVPYSNPYSNYTYATFLHHQRQASYG
jgi:hypothetical protein